MARRGKAGHGLAGPGKARQGLIRASGSLPGPKLFGRSKMNSLKTCTDANRSRVTELLPAVRSILPLSDVAALNCLAGTLCDVIKTMLAVPPATPVPETLVVPPLTPQEFLFSALLDGPQPAKAVKSVARERHRWPPRVLFKVRRAMRVKAVRRGFGPGGCWVWKLPDHMTDKEVRFHAGEWRNWIAGHRASVHRPNLDASS